jgi:hypothetical protein
VSGDYVAVRIDETQKPINERLDSTKAKTMKLKRDRLSAIIKCLVYCWRQNIAISGHANEAIPLRPVEEYQPGIVLGDKNRGNFMQLMEFRREAGDQSFDSYVNKKALYTSPAIQNEILNIKASQLTIKTVAQVTKSKYFSVIADETRDISNVEQLCVALRFYDMDTVQETFLSFVPLASLKGNILSPQAYCHSLILNGKHIRLIMYDNWTDMMHGLMYVFVLGYSYIGFVSLNISALYMFETILWTATILQLFYNHFTII